MSNKYTFDCQFYDTECKSWMCDTCQHNPNNKNKTSGEIWQHSSFY